jgi:hypothetical protein
MESNHMSEVNTEATVENQVEETTQAGESVSDASEEAGGTTSSSQSSESPVTDASGQAAEDGGDASSREVEE